MRFGGGRFDAASADFRLDLQSLNLFGEGALSTGRGTAIAGGLGIKGGNGFSVLIHVRNYSPRFDNPYAGGFGDNDETRNERGVYVGITHAPLRGLTLRMYYDHCVHPMPGGLSRFPTAANDLMVEADAEPTPRLSLHARYTLKNGPETFAGRDDSGRETRGEADRFQGRLRLTLSFGLSRHLRFTTRWETTRVVSQSAGSPRGYMIYDDLQVQIPPLMSISARLVLFNCDAYDARLYEFENDLPGQFTSQVLYGRGRRLYLNARITPARFCTVSLKAAVLAKEGGVASGAQPHDFPPMQQVDVSAQVDIRI
jgi:hypothetical protein